jgi:hypothetical protein
MYRGLINKYGKIELVPSFNQVNSDSILFVAQDENEEKLKASLDAAKEAFLIEDINLKNSQFHKDNSAYYTYMYFSEPSLPSMSSVFYVGKGKGSRWTDHIKSRLKKNDLIIPNKKERLIDTWIKSNSKEILISSKNVVKKAENSLVRKISQWSDKYSELKSFTMEYVLIAGRLGVFELANDTGGNSIINNLKLLVLPANLDMSIIGNKKLWNRAITEFEKNNHKYLEPALYFCSAKKIVDEITKQLFKLGFLQHPISHGRKEITHMPSHCAVDGAGDQSLYFRTKDELPFCVQLLLSKKEEGVRINLRPYKRTLKDFKNFGIFLNQVSIDQKNLNNYYNKKFQIRNKGRDAFFKPFARDCKGHNDPVFPIDNTEISVQVNWLTSHHKLTLTSALKHLINYFN